MSSTAQLSTTMLAAQIVEFNQPFSINKIPPPPLTDLRAHELYIKVAVASLCHPDLEYLAGTFPDITRPITGSHEGTGTVLAHGDAITEFNAGDRVLVNQVFNRCQTCDICEGPELYRQYCPDREPLMSLHRNGAFQEYLVIDGREAVLIPDAMSFATAAPLACAGMTSWRGVKQCDLQPGQWITIVGSGGGLGHLGVQFAKRVFGLRVVGIDARDEGLALSREVGADLVLDARMGRERLVDELRRETDGKGVHAALNVSGARSAVSIAIAVTRDHGRVVQVGLINEIIMPFRDLIYRNITLKGSFMASRTEIQDMLHAIVEHRIKLENNVFYGIAEIPRVVELLREGRYRGKASIVVDGEARGLVPDVNLI